MANNNNSSASTTSRGWQVSEDRLEVKTAATLEAIYTLANGYRSLRGSSPFLKTVMPGNFIAGIFDTSEATVTELVNTPDPTPVGIFVDQELAEIGKDGLSSYNRVFDLFRGAVVSSANFRASSGAELEIRVTRFVSHATPERWGEEWTVLPRNFSRRILLRAAIDGSIVSNRLHPLEATKHYQINRLDAVNDLAALPCGIMLLARTNDEGIEIAEAQTFSGLESLKLIKVRKLGESIEGIWQLDVESGKESTFYRLGVTCTSRDQNLEMEVGTENSLRPDTAKRAELALESFITDGGKKEFLQHQKSITKLWDQIDIEIEGDERAQKGLRYNLFQLACCADPHNDKVSIGAKGLHGEGYRGHVFWDTETFMLPFFIFTQPEVARSLLRYRFRTLEGARENARISGYKGARFPWESADTGRETTPRWGLDYAGNPVRIWTGDIEVHINADISYALLKYWQVSGDEKFMKECGLQMLLEIALFWVSYVVEDAETKRFVIRGIIGPDEFHEHVDNNTYTNYLVRWALLKTLEIYDDWKSRDASALTAILSASGVIDSDFALFRDVANRLYIPDSGKDGLLEQFEGYFALEEWPITEWDANGMPRWPKGLDLSKISKTRLIKQPDIVMLFALVGEEFNHEIKLLNYEFYEKRTMHKSSLSPSIYAMVGMSLGNTEHAYDYFLKAIETDLADNQGNTAVGIHGANMGGAWQTAVFGFGGLSINSDGMPRLDPWLPPKWNSLSYTFVWHGNSIHVTANRQNVIIQSKKDIRIIIFGQEILCKGAEKMEVKNMSN